MPDPKGKLFVPVAFRTSGLLRALGITDNDYLKVSLPAAASSLVGDHGWIGGEWHKNPLLLGYSSQLAERLIDSDMGAGTDSIDGTPVPSGELWVVTSVAMSIVSATCTSAEARLVIGAVDRVIFKQPAPVSNVTYDRQPSIVLKEGDFIRFTARGLTAGDDGLLDYYGYRVDIDQ